MSKEGTNEVLTIIDVFWTDLLKGCQSYSRQIDSKTGKAKDICMYNQANCPFYQGLYITRSRTKPIGRLSKYDVGMCEGVPLGICRMQKDLIRLGPLPLFDKLWIRPTPAEKTDLF